jgi:MOSC domain-containing protein YiiM
LELGAGRRVVSGTVAAVCISPTKHDKKTSVGRGLLKADWGIEGDAHAGESHRQVSLLAVESVQKMEGKGMGLGPGIFAENLTTKGIDLTALKLGDRLRIGPDALCEVTQKGKECLHPCAVSARVGFCVMPVEGVFVRVLAGGEVKEGDPIEVVE